MTQETRAHVYAPTLDLIRLKISGFRICRVEKVGRKFVTLLYPPLA